MPANKEVNKAASADDRSAGDAMTATDVPAPTHTTPLSISLPSCLFVRYTLASPSSDRDFGIAPVILPHNEGARILKSRGGKTVLESGASAELSISATEGSSLPDIDENYLTSTVRGVLGAYIGKKAIVDTESLIESVDHYLQGKIGSMPGIEELWLQHAVDSAASARSMFLIYPQGTKDTRTRSRASPTKAWWIQI